MKKLIIENRSPADWDSCLRMVERVINMGRISETYMGKQYCFCTTFNSPYGEVFVSAHKNKSSDRFVIHMNDRKDWQ